MTEAVHRARPFDVSLHLVGDGAVDVRSSAGYSHPWGEGFDRRQAAHPADTFRQENGIDPPLVLLDMGGAWRASPAAAEQSHPRKENPDGHDS